MINLFHKNHPNKPTVNFFAVNIIPLMAKPATKSIGKAWIKKKQGHPLKTGANKQAKNQS